MYDPDYHALVPALQSLRNITDDLEISLPRYHMLTSGSMYLLFLTQYYLLQFFHQQSTQLLHGLAGGIGITAPVSVIFVAGISRWSRTMPSMFELLHCACLLQLATAIHGCEGGRSGAISWTVGIVIYGR